MLVSLLRLIPPLPKKSGCQIYFHFNDVTMRRIFKAWSLFGKITCSLEGEKKIIYTCNDTTVSLYPPDLDIIDEVFIGRFNSLISFQLRMFSKSVEVVGCVMYITSNCNWCFLVFAGKHSLHMRNVKREICNNNTHRHLYLRVATTPASCTRKVTFSNRGRQLKTLPFWTVIHRTTYFLSRSDFP